MAGSVTGQFIKIQPEPLQPMVLQSVAVLHYRESRLQLPVSVDPMWVAKLLQALS